MQLAEYMVIEVEARASDFELLFAIVSGITKLDEEAVLDIVSLRAQRSVAKDCEMAEVMLEMDDVLQILDKEEKMS